jgi:hypothetical protein
LAKSRNITSKGFPASWLRGRLKKLQKVGAAGFSGHKSVLALVQKVVLQQVLHDSISDDGLQDFAADWGERNRMVIPWVRLGSLFENGCDIRAFLVLRHFSVPNGPPKYQNQSWYQLLL